MGTTTHPDDRARRALDTGGAAHLRVVEANDLAVVLDRRDGCVDDGHGNEDEELGLREIRMTRGAREHASRGMTAEATSGGRGPGLGPSPVAREGP